VNTKSIHGHRNAVWVAGAIALSVTVAALSACGGPSTPQDKAVEVIAIDRSHSAAGTGSWPQEVAGIVQQQTRLAFENNVGRIVLVSIGTNTYDAAKVAQVDLKVSCSNDNVCKDNKTIIATELGNAAGQVAAATVRKPGTDIVAALVTAKAICASAPCTISLVTDGGDSRLNAPGTPQQLVKKFAIEFPNLNGVKVQLIGLGADGTDRTHVDRTKAFWTLALEHAGANDPIVARSI